jgi:hypothetical protein
MIHSLVSLKPGPNTTPITWQGRTYHAREDVLSGFDKTFLEAARTNVVVSAILLVANPARGNDPVVAIIGHPDAVREGTFAMPNVTDPEGIALYGAILNLMAERWSRPTENSAASTTGSCTTKWTPAGSGPTPATKPARFTWISTTARCA